MDFDLAAKRLERDQKQFGQQQRQRRQQVSEVSAKAKRLALIQKQRQEERLKLKRQEERKREKIESLWHKCERTLGVKPLGSSSGGAETASDDKKNIAATGGGSTSSSSLLLLQPTSIHGDGDKIALPPSILERLTNSNIDDNEQTQSQSQQQQSWTFRIGIRNPNYTKFPASPLWKDLLSRLSNDDDEEEEDPSSHSIMMDDDHDDGLTTLAMEAYVDELKHQYLSYTHGTVVEFTQDEAYVGIPKSIAQALLLNNNDNTMPTFRTVDPANKIATTTATRSGDDGDHDELGAIDIDDNDEKTPGHLAYGAFDLPNAEIEITLVKLPKGQTTQLLPSRDAVQNGFYNLKDIKLVLEQSLIRTRATLSVGDQLVTWHRGQQFDLTVEKVTPSFYNSISIINTDLEVEFGSLEPTSGDDERMVDTAASHGGRTLRETTTTTGRRLQEESPSSSRQQQSSSTTTTTGPHMLLPSEPPVDQTENVITIQIRAPNGVVKKKGLQMQYRLDIRQHQISDLFAIAQQHLLLNDDNETTTTDFQLVTRFPRRVFTHAQSELRLEEAGLSTGQELFLIEMI